MTTNNIALFREKLTSLGDIYVNDAFGTCHRAHSSIVGVKLPIRAAGLLVQKEMRILHKAVNNPDRPLTVVIGGVKVSENMPLLMNLIKFADNIIIGGGMAHTFLKYSRGMEVGDSVIEKKMEQNVRELLFLAENRNVKIHLPEDFECARDM